MKQENNPRKKKKILIKSYSFVPETTIYFLIYSFIYYRVISYSVRYKTLFFQMLSHSENESENLTFLFLDTTVHLIGFKLCLFAILTAALSLGVILVMITAQRVGGVLRQDCLVICWTTTQLLFTVNNLCGKDQNDCLKTLKTSDSITPEPYQPVHLSLQAMTLTQPLTNPAHHVILEKIPLSLPEG